MLLWQQVHDDELPLAVGDVITLLAPSQDIGWYDAVNQVRNLHKTPDRMPRLA